MNPPWPPAPDPWFFVVGVVCGIGFWCCVLAMVSYVGGWHSLAKTYRDEATSFRIAAGEEGRRFRWASLSMGPSYFPTNYGSCVNLVIDDHGIGLKVSLIFRFLHPPLLIPWSAIEKCELDKLFFFYWRATVHLIGRPHPLRFYGRCAQEVERVWSKHTTAASDGASTVLFSDDMAR